MLPMNPNPGTGTHFAQVLLTSAMVMLATWPWLEWKGIVSFLPIWIVFEVVYRIRIRAQMACPHCGFDPFLQMIDAKKSREEVISFWKKKFDEKGMEFLDAEQIRLKKYRVQRESTDAPPPENPTL